MSRCRNLIAVLLLVSACMPARQLAKQPGPLDTNRTTTADASGKHWADSVLSSLSLREKAAQMVWPTVLGDYTSGDSPQWQRLTNYVSIEKVGGFTISVGSPTEVASKLNALQSMSRIPMLFGADLEAGAGVRARGGYILSKSIHPCCAGLSPPAMATCATTGIRT